MEPIAIGQVALFEDQTEARDRAIEKVENPPWQSFAIKAIEYICEEVGPDRLTSDDVWHQLDQMKIPRPAEPRAMGAAMQKATKMGLIEPTTQFHISTDTASPNHRRPQRVYQTRS